MIENKFSNARIVEAAQYALIHNGEITNKTLLAAAKQAKVFEQNALMGMHKGKLVSTVPGHDSGNQPAVFDTPDDDDVDEAEEED